MNCEGLNYPFINATPPLGITEDVNLVNRKWHVSLKDCYIWKNLPLISAVTLTGIIPSRLVAKICQKSVQLHEEIIAINTLSSITLQMKSDRIIPKLQCLSSWVSRESHFERDDLFIRTRWSVFVWVILYLPSNNKQ